jgi:hypothetical protein
MGRCTFTAEQLELPVERLWLGSLMRGQHMGRFEFARGSLRPELRNGDRRDLAAAEIARTPTAARFSSAATNPFHSSSSPLTADCAHRG